MYPTVYSFDRSTRVFTGTSPADPDPLDVDGFLMPAFATLVPVPQQIPAGMVPVFNEEAGSWSLVSAELFEPAEEPAPELTLEQVKFIAQAAVDSHFEHLYSDAVPNAAIANEYTSAYLSATRWIASLGGPIVLIVPKRVTALAESMGVTERQAADYVVAKYIEADRVLDARGAARLRAKAAIRAAADKAGVSAAMEAGKAAMQAVGYTI